MLDSAGGFPAWHPNIDRIKFQTFSFSAKGNTANKACGRGREERRSNLTTFGMHAALCDELGAKNEPGAKAPANSKLSSTKHTRKSRSREAISG